MSIFYPREDVDRGSEAVLEDGKSEIKKWPGKMLKITSGSEIEWVGARHLYLNFDDPQLLVLISGYPRFLNWFSVWP